MLSPGTRFTLSLHLKNGRLQVDDRRPMSFSSVCEDNGIRIYIDRLQNGRLTPQKVGQRGVESMGEGYNAPGVR